MSHRDDDDAFERAVDQAAEAIPRVGFYRAVSDACASYRQDWMEVQNALADRSAAARHARAEQKKNRPANRIKAMCQEWRKEQKAKAKQEKSPPQKPIGGLF